MYVSGAYLTASESESLGPVLVYVSMCSFKSQQVIRMCSFS